MKRRAALFELLLAIASEQVGTAAMMASEGFTSLGPTVLAIAGYVFSLIFFGRCMRILPMGFAYALWVGLGMITASVIGVVLFKETLQPRRSRISSPSVAPVFSRLVLICI